MLRAGLPFIFQLIYEAPWLYAGHADVNSRFNVLKV
jgi:hypothetical protein